ncbi:MAG: hypothetical protein MZV64_69470 [Ignavibacteriales bacterium]|nr:hypothetical protein [Ignavibacteriales bacterium]
MSDTLVIYGNELYAPNHTDYMNNVLDKNQVYPKIYYVINNVIYGGSADLNLFNISTDTAYCYNNIFQHGVALSTAGIQYIYPFSSYSGDWAWTDGNLYGDNCSAGFYASNMTTMNSWDAETSGNPSARYLVDPLFVDAPDGVDKGIDVDFEAQSTSPAINAGVDMQSLVEGLGMPWTDIDGNSLDSTPDCGAYQY